MRDSLVSGKYRLVTKLGQGGMGSVWRADHLTLRSQVAIKLIDPSIAASNEALGRFNREARAAAALRSPHVVQILDHGVDDGLPFIVMELLEGESLGKSLERRGRLPSTEVARIMTHMARALARAHDVGIVHRDLKPDNVFLVTNDDEIVVKVLDFGIAKGDGAGGAPAGFQTRTGAVLGTPYYMSPEQVMGERSIDGRSDLWAMGVIAFECLLGEKPFQGSSMAGLMMAICTQPLPVPSRAGIVPAGFDDWFARCCAREREARFASAKIAASELNMICLAPAASLPRPALQATVPMSTLPILPASARPASPDRPVARVETVSDVSLSAPTSRRVPIVVSLGVVGVGVVATLLLKLGGASQPFVAAATASVGSGVAVPAIAVPGTSSVALTPAQAAPLAAPALATAAPQPTRSRLPAAVAAKSVGAPPTAPVPKAVTPSPPAPPAATAASRPNMGF